MLRTLLTPLTSGFSLTSPRSNLSDNNIQREDPQSPEDFARDAMIDLMRFHAEQLRSQNDVAGRMRVKSFYGSDPPI